MQYTKVEATAFEKLQINAGILVESFTPNTATVGNILGATTGGLAVATNPTYIDFGEDVDNCPPNTYQLKRVQYYDPTITGTFLSITDALAKKLSGAGAVASNKVTPSHTLVAADFNDFWVIGDYSDKNTGTTAGYVAFHLMKGLNTSGFQWQTTKDGKGQFSFEFHGHYDLANIDTVPYEIYVKTGTTGSGT